MISFMLFLWLYAPVSHAAELVATLHIEQATQVLDTSVPRGAQRVRMLRLSLTAGCKEDVNISSITLHHQGKGDASDILRVYAVQDRRRISRAAAIQSHDRSAVLRLGSYHLPRCRTHSIDILADISPDAATGGEHALAVLQQSDVERAENVTVTLGKPSASSSVLRTVPSQSGIVEVTFLPLNAPVRFGKGRIVSRFHVHGTGEVDQEIHSITLTNDGSARNADLQQLILLNGRSQILAGPVASLTGNRVELLLSSPLTLSRNETLLLQLRANVQASRRRTIQFVVEDPSDIVATRKSGARRILPAE